MWNCYSIKSFRDSVAGLFYVGHDSASSTYTETKWGALSGALKAKTLLTLTTCRRICSRSVDTGALCGADGKRLVTVCLPFRRSSVRGQSPPPTGTPRCGFQNGSSNCHHITIPWLKPLLGTAQCFWIRLHWLLHPRIWHLCIFHILPHCHWVPVLYLLAIWH